MDERENVLQWRLDGARAEADADWTEADWVDTDIDYPPESEQYENQNEGIVPWK